VAEPARRRAARPRDDREVDVRQRPPSAVARGVGLQGRLEGHTGGRQVALMHGRQALLDLLARGALRDRDRRQAEQAERGGGEGQGAHGDLGAG
jgi:hypothetical protein